MVTVPKKMAPNITPNTASLREMKRISFHHFLVENPEMEGLRSIPATMELLTRGAFRELAIFPPTELQRRRSPVWNKGWDCSKRLIR